MIKFVLLNIIIEFMKSSVEMLRVFYLLLVFLIPHILSVAHTSDPEIIALSAFEDTTTISKQAGISGSSYAMLKAPLAIDLTVDAYQSRIALLKWSDPGLPGTFTVERYADISGWMAIKYLPSAVLEYNDTISYPFCSPVTLSYRVSFVSSDGSFITTSSQVDGVLNDKNSPADVQNLNVDLVFHQNAFSPCICWDNITNDSIQRYEIERFDGFSWPSVGSVDADSNRFYDKSVSNACESSLKYMVFSYDMCGNASGQQVVDDLAVQTIKLEVAFPDQCDKYAKLQWNPFIHMAGGLAGYKIFRSNSHSTAEIVETQNTTFTDNFDFNNGQTYIYTVMAISGNGINSSSSCEVVGIYNGVIVPDTVYITNVSVEDDSYIRIGYHLSPADAVKKLILERSEDGGSTFHSIDSLPLVINGIVAPDHFFIDSDVEVHQQSYYYRLVAFDDCGYPTPSNTSRSIFFECTTNETQNSMQWNKYEYWQKGVKMYDVYRVLNRELSSVTAIGNVDPATTSFSELHLDYDNSKEACYWVEATENPGNYLNNPISVSNTCCIIKDPVLFMPNAFRPDGVNKLFRPVPKPLYIDSQTFKMTVFNKWGQQLFETADIEKGWDGTYNGQTSPAGVYSYVISYKSSMGEEFVKRGTVLLLR